ncbi:MAG: hypothetical protein IT170_11320, partial [Bryobacterales bacterium]|nr:hypothetical protein [Bryobacterales bacterium]
MQSARSWFSWAVLLSLVMASAPLSVAEDTGSSRPLAEASGEAHAAASPAGLFPRGAGRKQITSSGKFSTGVAADFQLTLGGEFSDGIA